MFQPVFTKEFLERELNRSVRSFTVAPGSKLGDNFMGVIYALDVSLKPQPSLHEPNDIEIERVHLIVKCYPSHPARHEYLNLCSVFHKELSIYQILVTELEVFLQNQGVPMRLPFAPFIAGKAINFSETVGIPKPQFKLAPPGDLIGHDANNNNTFLYGPLDNFLMLTDVRKTSGFKMASHQSSLDWDHCSLVVSKLAKIHAISWAYQNKIGTPRLSDHFNCLKQMPSDLLERQNYLNSHFESALETLETRLGHDSPVVLGTKAFKATSGEVLGWFLHDELEFSGLRETELDRFMRIKPPEDAEDYVPWRVFCHGDCWTNNMLFRYNAGTLAPEEVVLVDFQVSKDACPTLDLAYMTYICTDQNFRQEYTGKLLEKYHDSFKHFCNILNVDLLPGFTLESLSKRFHRSKLYAYCLSVVVLPIILKQHCTDLDTLEQREGMGTGEIFLELLNGFSKTNLLQQRIIEVASDFYNDGII